MTNNFIEARILSAYVQNVAPFKR